jgi:hypothetical protein
VNDISLTAVVAANTAGLNSDVLRGVVHESVASAQKVVVAVTMSPALPAKVVL